VWYSGFRFGHSVPNRRPGVFKHQIRTALRRVAMTALRTTRPADSRPLRSLRRVCLVSLAPPAAFGGGAAARPPRHPPPAARPPPPTVGVNDPNWLTSRPFLPPPDTDRIDYDAQQRTLTFYELPGRDHWVVQLPDDAPRPVGPTHRLPEGVDPAQIRVWYTRPG